MTFGTCCFIPLFDLETVNPGSVLMKISDFTDLFSECLCSTRYMRARCCASLWRFPENERLHFSNCYVLGGRSARQPDRCSS